MPIPSSAPRSGLPSYCFPPVEVGASSAPQWISVDEFKSEARDATLRPGLPLGVSEELPPTHLACLPWSAEARQQAPGLSLHADHQVHRSTPHSSLDGSASGAVVLRTVSDCRSSDLVQSSPGVNRSCCWLAPRIAGSFIIISSEICPMTPSASWAYTVPDAVLSPIRCGAFSHVSGVPKICLPRCAGSCQLQAGPLPSHKYAPIVQVATCRRITANLGGGSPTSAYGPSNVCPRSVGHRRPRLRCCVRSQQPFEISMWEKFVVRP